MLRLLLLRHAKAAWPQGTPDIERPLAARGHKAAGLMGQYLKDEGLVPDLAIVSTARRTQETWNLVQPFLGEIETRHDRRIYEAPSARLLQVLHEIESGVQSVMMIGHNPGFEDLASFLVGAGDRHDILRMSHKYPTAGLAVIDFPHDSWAHLGRKDGSLERFVTPKSVGADEDD